MSSHQVAYQDLIDAESYRVATEWLKDINQHFAQQVQYESPESCLRAYREFSNQWKKLPAHVAKYMTIQNAYPGCIPGSWGHWSVHWITLLHLYIVQQDETEVDGYSLPEALALLVGTWEGKFLPEGYCEQLIIS